MEVKDNYDIVNWKQEVEQAEAGKAVKILTDTFLAKAKDQNGHTVNTYALRHENRHDILLVDTVYPENKSTLDHFKEAGYNIKGIVVTSDAVAKHSFKDFKEIAESYNTEIFMHKLDDNSDYQCKDIMDGHDCMKSFQIKPFHFPGYTGGSVMLYSDYNGALFAGHSAKGAEWKDGQPSFTRPDTNDAEDSGLMDNWMSFDIDFEHLLPASGQPQLKIDDEARNAIIRSLGKK